MPADRRSRPNRTAKYVKCRCNTFGCGRTRQGYRDQQTRTARRHAEADAEAEDSRRMHGLPPNLEGMLGGSESDGPLVEGFGQDGGGGIGQDDEGEGVGSLSGHRLDDNGLGGGVFGERDWDGMGAFSGDLDYGYGLDDEHDGWDGDEEDLWDEGGPMEDDIPIHPTIPIDYLDNTIDNLDDDGDHERPPSPTYSLDFEQELVRPFADLGIFDSDSDEEDNNQTGDRELPPDFEALDLTSDPLRATRDDIIESLEDTIPKDQEQELPPAFSEAPEIRHAYVRAFVAAAFKGSTHAATQITLEGFKTVLQSIQDRNSMIKFEGLSDMARTLPTAERRLGLSTDGFIKYYALCDMCWATHHLDTLSRLQSTACSVANCEGRIYTEKQLGSGRIRRIPIKILSYVPPRRAIQNLLLRPGKYEDFQKWRKADADAPARTPPLEKSGYDAFDNLDEPMKDVYDGWRWRAMQAGLERRQGGPWGMEDVDVRELNQRFVSLPCGLLIQINLDWFQAVKNTSHSSGALYFTVLNNPREVRYRREETVLVMAIPGPHEPTQTQLNQIMNLFVNDLLTLSKGSEFRVYGHELPELVHLGLHSGVSDLPAGRKMAGLHAPNSKYFMCPCCKAPFYTLVDPNCYDPSKFVLREEWRYIKYAFRAQSADPDLAANIDRYRGVRWSPLYRIPGWMPARDSPADFMHCVFLCIIKHTNRSIIYKPGLLNATSRTRNPQDRFVRFFENVIWPASVGRLPASVAKGSGSVKADQWRSQFTVLFIALFEAWQVNGEIPDEDAPRSSPKSKLGQDEVCVDKLLRARLLENLLARNSSPSPEELRRVKSAAPHRNIRRHYDIILQLTVAIFILWNRAISPNDVKRGSAALARAFQAWARMGVHMTPYFHLAMHFPAIFLAFGPCYAWWTYPYERNNGFLGRFNHNGHAGGELEATMMRGWWKSMFVHELISHFERMPNRTSEDEDALRLLKSCLQGEVSKKGGGTLQSYLAQMSAGYDTDPIRFPKNSSSILDVRTIGDGFFITILEFLRQLWEDSISLVAPSDLSTAGAVTFLGKVRSFSHVHIHGLRYGSAHATRGRAAQFGYIDGRTPVRIEYILQAQHQISDNDMLTGSFAIVRRFKNDGHLPEFPWDVWASDLGTGTWYAEEYEAPELVLLERFSGHLVIAPITVGRQNIWITVPFNHVKPEEDADVPEVD